MSKATDTPATALTEDLSTWSAVQTPVMVQYSRAVMNEIRLEATDKFMSIPRGGIEIGGVLFGLIEGDRVTIRARRPLALEYQTGPNFVLSPSDEESLRNLLDSAAAEPELEGLGPVGWYHSHTRSEVFLSAEDVAVHDKFFPGPRQVALVVRPVKFEPTRAGFFVREPDGSIVSDASYNEFLIESARAIRETSQVVRPEPSTTLEPVAPKTIVMRSRPLAMPRTSARTKLAIPAVAAIVVMIAALAVMAPRGGGPQAAAAKPAPVLRLSGSGDNLLIEWSSAATAVTEASRGALEIFDGGAGKLSIPLDRESVRRGSITYARNSGNIEVRLRLYEADSISGEAVARYLKPAAQPPEAQRARATSGDVPDRDATVRERSAEDVQDETKGALARASVKNSAKPLPRGRGSVTLLRGGSELTEPRAQASGTVGDFFTGTEQAPQITSSLTAPTLLPRIQVQSAPTPSVPLASGRTMWTGELRKGGILMIDAGRPSTGTLNSRVPAGPIRINAHPAELIDGGIVVYQGGAQEPASEPPSARNGWNLTLYRSDPKRARDISIVEPPSQHNNWRLIVRGGSRNVGLIVLDWQQLARVK